MPLAERTLIVFGLIVAATLRVAAQPVTENEGASAWWGAGVWILITLVLLIGAGILLAKALKRPNR